MRLHTKFNALKLFNAHIVAYPTPMNLNWSWNFGSLAGLMLSVQLVTGILLAMHYTANISYAFDSVIHIMHDVPYGTLIRYAHANGASMFFAVVYIHILRGIYYNSYQQPRELVWVTGIIIMLLMIITAFIGYVLPWGQMSYWGATVITSLVTTIPVIGQPILFWLCGAYTVDNPTLNRFYSLHYLLPFVLAGLSILHIAALHQYGSSNPIGINTASSVIPFSTYFGLKDLIGVLVLAMVYISLICFEPELLGHTDNLIPANPYVTPKHIQPEWYFLWFYAILRSIPSKALGVIAIALVFTSLMVLPYICLPAVGSPKYRVISERLHWFFIANLGLLTYIGACDITPTSTLAGQLCSLALFGYILVIMPLVGWFESMIYRHARS